MRCLYPFTLSLGLSVAFTSVPNHMLRRRLDLEVSSGIAAVNPAHEESVEVTRREAFKKSVLEGSLLAAALATGASPSFARSVAAEVAILEKKNIATVNSNGAPEKHLPQVTVSESGDVQVVVPHVMDPDKPHWIQAIWLTDEATGKVAAAEMFPSTAPSPPTLNFSGTTSGSKLTPFLYCNLHGLWKGETFTV